MFHDLRTALTERYAQELTQMDRTEFEDFLTAEATRLEAEIAQTQSQTELAAIAAWKNEHGGNDPDVLTTQRLYQQARYAAEETVLATLWEGMSSPEDDDDPLDDEPNPDTMTGMQRWLTPWAIEATRETEQLTEQVWPNQTPRFQVWAEQLLQARLTDRLPVPDGPEHPLVPELTAMVDAALADQARADAERAQR
ncbi:hypothetical protein GKZ92_23390 (plasmid) [Gordonia sp. 135]|uniref:hypothetical protein n=1 Tax=Gordonia sp. 135 TaxID=2676309 RepID=UPI0012BB1FFE|nr:hypothetical protein [Gordonia sp. 135]QGP90653.1 hypothetical protein GKZ92_23390 [Gordonia sp. 135]